MKSASGSSIRILSILLLMIAVTFAAGSIHSAAAQQMPAPIIAVIDVNAVERQSLAWKSLRAQMEVKSADVQQQLQGEQAALEEEQRNLLAQQNILAPEIFQERQQEFRTKLGELQNVARQRKLDLERSYANGRRQIRKVLTEVTTEIARERGVNLMLNISREDSTISFVDKNLIVSEEALKRLNERLTSVNLEAEQ